MKVSTSRTELFTELQTVTRAASTRSAVQALSGVQLTAKGGAIELRATDMEIGLRVPLQGEIVRDGAVVLPARLLVDVVRALPGDSVSLELRGAEQDVEIVAGSATFHIRTLRLEDFPPFPEPEGDGRVEVPGPAFVETVLKVARSASRDETRPVLTGILVSASESELRMVATDSYRLSVKETKLEAPLAGSFEANVPARALQELTRIVQQTEAEQLSVSVRTNQVIFEAGGVVLSSRLIDGQFPNYRQLLPDAYEHELPLGGTEITEVVRRISLLAQKNAPLRLAFAEGELTVSARTPDVGEAQESLPVPFQGEPLEIGFNPEFLRDGLEAVESGRRAAEAHLAPAPGAARGRGRQRVPVPADADPAERVSSDATVRVTRLSLRNFRSYEAEEVRLGPGLTVVTGPNGAGKTNLLEALYFACTGRSCRTANEREVVRFGAGVARLELDAERDGDSHRITVGFEPGEAKRLAVDGAPVDRLTDSAARPLVSVFLPDRLDLVLGAPALRRAHLDQVIAALWPTRVGTRRAYSAALAQRNALLGAIRAGRAGRGSLPAWDQELARHGVALAADRAAAVAELDGAVRRARRDARARGRRGARLPAALEGRDARRSWPRSSPSAWTPTSSAASPATARTATSWCCAAPAGSCGPTGRAGSSGSGCCRCCWPSAACSPPSAGPRR